MSDEQDAVPHVSCSSFSSHRICLCTVTSSAVVGSSAISKPGLASKREAIITRWRMPPESSCGYCRAALRPIVAGARSISVRAPGRPGATCRDDARDSHRSSAHRCSNRIERSHRILGIIAISRRAAHAECASDASRCPGPSPQAPAPRRRGGRQSPSIASAVIDLPLPLSPTRHSISPGAIHRSTPRTASAGRRAPAG